MHLDVRPPDDDAPRDLDHRLSVAAYLVLAACASLGVLLFAGAWALWGEAEMTDTSANLMAAMVDDLNKANEESRLTVGTIVAITCIDMSYYADTISETFPFELSKMTIFGQIVRSAHDCIAVAHQVHTEDGQVRHVSVIPRSAILNVQRLYDS